MDTSNRHIRSWYGAAVAATSLISMLLGCGRDVDNKVIVGSKNFTEQAIVGEMLAILIEEKTDLTVERKLVSRGHPGLPSGAC